MAFAPTPIHIELTDDERSELERMARGQALPHRTVIRAQVVLAFADGKTVSAVARQAGRQRRIVRKWAERLSIVPSSAIFPFPKNVRYKNVM